MARMNRGLRPIRLSQSFMPTMSQSNAPNTAAPVVAARAGDIPQESDLPGLAVFDFDGTLARGDSLLPFLARVAGGETLRRHLAGSVAGAASRRLPVRPLAGRHLPGRETLVKGGDAGDADDDFKTAFKRRLLRRCLAGVPLERAQEAAAEMGAWVRWHTPLRDTLMRHADQGHRILVATGALTLYMPALLADLPVHDLLGTEMAVGEDGLLTGEMVAGNCVRAEKARRLALWMEETGPYGRRWGYGNQPSDLPFLALMDEATVVPTAH
ncbi:HAD superfamily phosphoserine phosphatase-like hydrolase [Nitrospirillum amazonense]|uniref:HAD superfamily phosphoserine phosphatase-like hydrolase n=1 Tax=Nitrospirillum amazonense TaxID=28077 RepID=A0A560JXS0_9PROT|nr:HAD superfamily phosphoserine phosphatase-like hydrolase [Nitrospirillum amazonense]